jgi:hypothetical protein
MTFLIPVAEPETAEELFELYRSVLARRDNPGVFKASKPKPVVIDVLARRRAEEALRKAEEEATRAEQARRAAEQARGALERSGALGSRRKAVAIVRAVAEKHSLEGSLVTAADIYGRSRSYWIRDARFEAIAAVALACDAWSLPTIGRFFGGRDHTTILHALRRMGVVRERQKPLTPPHIVAAVLRANAYGLSAPRIAQIHDLDPSTVRKLIAKHENIE